MIKADIHVHTSFSSDCAEPMENQIKQAISLGLETLCFTEHMDKDYPLAPGRDISEGPEFLLDTEKYREGFLEMRDKYAGRIKLLWGVELGLQPHLSDWCREYVAKYDFDFIIGSVHTVDRKDPYYPAFFEGRPECESYAQYFEEMLTDLNGFSDFDTLGHLDYIVRYGPNKNRDYTFERYAKYIDPVLKFLVDNGIALEANSAGYRKGLGEPNPCSDVLLRYKELGGKLITIGSDSHQTSSLGNDFSRIESLLLECGFTDYAVFEGRSSTLYPLG